MSSETSKLFIYFSTLVATMLAGCTTAATTGSIPELPGLATPPSQKPDATEAAISAAISLAERTQGTGQPAMWRYGDEDTTVHVFGVPSFFDPGSDWRTPDFDTALSTADTLVFEADTLSASAEAKIQRAINDRGLFTDGRLLSDVLSDTVEARLRSATARLEIPYAAAESFKPWMVAGLLDMTAAQTGGFQPTADLEQLIIEENSDEPKAIIYLSEANTQPDTLGNLTLDSQIDRLTVAAISAEMAPAFHTAVNGEWTDGDVAGLLALTTTPLIQGGNATYEALIVTQNEIWARKLTGLLDEPGTKLVVLNTSYLLGPSGLIARIEASAIDVTGP
ncbi:MAG: TraB/GumN family protein [Pseudomonadota bacterium]